MKAKETFENLLCKILTSDEINQISRTIIEIECDNGLFFYLKCEVNSELFEEIKENQNLTCNFNDFSYLIINFFDNCKRYEKIFSSF